MALLLGLTKVHDWRASAIASLAANVHNYVLINFRAFADRSHKEFRKLEGYLSYLLVSAAGLAFTTGSYAGLVWGMARTSLLQGGTAAHVSLIRLSCQFVAVLLGVWFNYVLNKVFLLGRERADQRADKACFDAPLAPGDHVEEDTERRVFSYPD